MPLIKKIAFCIFALSFYLCISASMYDPLVGDSSSTSPISSGFGPRNANMAGSSTFHNGIDYSAINGSFVYYVSDSVTSVPLVSIAYEWDTEAGYTAQAGFFKYLHLKKHTSDSTQGIFELSKKNPDGTWGNITKKSDKGNDLKQCGVFIVSPSDPNEAIIYCSNEYYGRVTIMAEEDYGVFNDIIVHYPTITSFKIQTAIYPSSQDLRRIAKSGNTRNESDTWRNHLHLAQYSTNKITNPHNPLKVVPYVDNNSLTINAIRKEKIVSDLEMILEKFIKLKKLGQVLDLTKVW